MTLEAVAALETPAVRAGRLRPADTVLGFVPEVQLTALAAHYLRQGQSVTARHGLSPGWVRIYDESQRFLGIGEILDDGQVAPRRLLSQARTVGG
jgi:tRNA pseudouridine55 synthase